MKGALVAHTVEHKWRKAERLLSQPDIVMPAPSADKSCKAFSVLSESVDAPHLVKAFNSAKITCTCKNYKPKNVCSHIIAVAEKHGVLNEFVVW